MENVTLGTVRYNPAVGAFEARVDIERGGTTYRYPCQLHGPLTLPEDQVRSGLARNAMRMSDSGGTTRSVM